MGLLKRIYPRQIQDKFYLSYMLEQLLETLAACPLHVSLQSLSYDAHIPAAIITRLAEMHRHPEDALNIDVDDFYIVFSNLLFRYPTVKIFRQHDGSLFFAV